MCVRVCVCVYCKIQEQKDGLMEGETRRHEFVRRRQLRKESLRVNTKTKRRKFSESECKRVLVFLSVYVRVTVCVCDCFWTLVCVRVRLRLYIVRINERIN